MKRLSEIYILTLYFGINSLFIFKYGLRQQFINPIYLLFSFPLALAILFFILDKIKIRLLATQTIYILIVVLFFTITIGVNLMVDGNQLNVDRWSALNGSILALLEGEYPYSVLDHLNQGSSNLPGLFIIGLPFYLLGNIGFLQSFTFLLFAYVLHRTLKNIKAKLFGLLILIFSASYLWEIYTKSDLVSNFIIIMGFSALFMNKGQFKRPIFLGSISGLLFFTRLVSIIPLTLFLFKDFVASQFKNKVLFLASSLIIVVFISYLVLMNCPSYEVFKNSNPLTLQNNYLPISISLLTIILPFFYSSKINTLSDLMRYSALLLSVPIVISFGLSIYNYGFDDIIYNSVFDISYFNIITPFLIYFIAIEYDKILNERNLS